MHRALSAFNRILMMKSIDSLASALISVFIAIYLLEIGYELSSVIYYLMVHHVVLLFASFFAVRLSNTIGLLRVLVIHSLLLIVYLILLFQLPGQPQLLFVIAIISGIESAFYWIPLNVLLVRKTTAEKMGSAYSTLLAIPKLVATLAPVTGAFIISQYGFNTLFFIAAILYLVSLVPLLPVRSEKTQVVFSLQRFREIYQKNKRFLIPEIIDNLAEDAMVLWSILIFLKLDSVLHVGGIATVVGITGIIFTLSLGKLTDHWNKHRLIKIGAFTVIIAWFVNYGIAVYSLNPLFFYFGTILISFALKTFMIPYGSLLYNRARKDDAQFLVLREIPTVFGRQILFIFALVFVHQFEIIFLLVALLFLYFVFLDPKKLETS